MKLFLKHTGIKQLAFVLPAAALVGGCCAKHRGGTYTYGSSAPYTTYEASTPKASAKTTGEYSAAATEKTTDNNVAATSAKSATASTNKEVIVPLYEEAIQVSNREGGEETVRLRKVVKTETVNQPVTIRKETLVIDRQPASASGDTTASTPNQAFQEQETVIQLKQQEPVVSTKVISSGNIVASTRVEETQTNVQHQIRKEVVELDKGGSEHVNVSQAVGGTVETSGEERGRGQGGTSGKSEASGGTGKSEGTITDINSIATTSNPNLLAGRNVKLPEATVIQIFDDQSFSVSAPGGKTVIIRNQDTTTEIKEQDKVSIEGTVKSATPADWTAAGLSQNAWGSNKGQALYVDAKTVKKK